ncbi:MAG: hypothetical protein EOO77_15960 [Oxalobacteraceae bacterium]|nr:MAG: hypothetical protein EOO77_15960 [Oxalobacteraceae bacterium]
MRNAEAAKLKKLSVSVIGRELAVAADQSLWAGNREECVSIVAQLYGLFDDLEQGIEPSLYKRLVATTTAAWIGDKERGTYAELLSDVIA